MESIAIDTIQNISDITLLMTYVKQKIHTNIFLNFVKHLVVYFALELWIYRHSVFCNKMDESIFFSYWIINGTNQNKMILVLKIRFIT